LYDTLETRARVVRVASVVTGNKIYPPPSFRNKIIYIELTNSLRNHCLTHHTEQNISREADSRPANKDIFPPSKETEFLLQCSLEPASGAYPEADESSLHVNFI